MIAGTNTLDYPSLRDRPLYSYLPPSVNSEGLTEEQERNWDEILAAKGRVPFIVYPIVCARCGRLWPEFFTVPDAEWNKYVHIDQRQSVLCLKCYKIIKKLIDSAAEHQN